MGGPPGSGGAPLQAQTGSAQGRMEILPGGITARSQQIQLLCAAHRKPRPGSLARPGLARGLGCLVRCGAGAPWLR